MVADADQGGFARTSATVGDLLEHWFAQARDDYSPKTVLETRSYLDRDLLPALGRVPLSKLRPEDLDRFYRGLRASRFARSAARARLSPAHSRHLAARPATGCPMGLDRHQPGRFGLAAEGAEDRRQATDARRSRSAARDWPPSTMSIWPRS